jgi:hypothetical protein
LRITRKGSSVDKKKHKSVGNGSGSVYPRRNKDGKITGYLGSYFGPDGKRRYVSGKTRTEARENLRGAMGNADKGLVYDAGTLTVGAYLARWLSDIEGTVSSRRYPSTGPSTPNYSGEIQVAHPL